MEQIMESLLAKTEAIERMEAKIGAEIKTILEKMDSNQEKMDDGQEETKSQVGSLASRIHVNQEEMKYMFDACLEKMETNPKEKEAVEEQQEVPKNEAAVETIEALEDRYGDGHLAVGRRRQPKKWTQGDGGSRQKFAAARGRVTRRAVPAPRKGPVKDDVVCGAPKGQTFERRRRALPKRNSGIRD
jgi:hypothetical protein